MIGAFFLLCTSLLGRPAAGPEAPIIQPAPTTLPGYRSPAVGRWLPPSDDSSGVPLGGVGTGFLELRPDGRIHDVRLRTLGPDYGSGAFRLSLSLGAAPFVTLISSVGLPNPAPAPARYFGHYPFVDLEYGRSLSAAHVDVSCRAFSPFVLGDVDLSNTPTAIFLVRLRNRTPGPVTARARLTWLPDPSMAPGEWRNPADGGPLRFSRGKDISFAITARSPGAEIKRYSQHGLELACSLAAGAERTIAFAASWRADFELGPDGVKRAPRYADRFSDAAEVSQLIDRAAEIENKIIAWQETIYATDDPPWLKDALVNSLYLLAKDTALLADGLYLVEQQGQIVEAVGSHLEGGLPICRFFPGLEEGVLRRLASRQTEVGEIPGRLGDGDISAGKFGPGRTLAAAEFILLCRRVSLETKDRSLEQQIYPAARRALDFLMSQDRDSDGLINEPALPAGLSDLDRYRRDWLFHGTSTHSAFLGLAAVKAAEQLAVRAKDEETADRCRRIMDDGGRALEENLWARERYRLFTDPDGFKQSDSSFIAALAGQSYAWLEDLGELTPTRRLEAQLLSTLDRHGKPSGEVPSGIAANGEPDSSGEPYSTATVPRDVWLFAAAYRLAAGKLEGFKEDRSLELAKRAYDAMIRSGTLWRQHSLYRAGDLAPIGDRDYFGNLAVWMLARPPSRKIAAP